MEPTVPWDVLLEILKGFVIFDENGELIKEKNESQVWQNIAKVLNFQKEAHTIYTDVQQNRHNLKTDLEKYFNIKKSNEAYEYVIPDDENSDSEQSESEESAEEYLPKRIPNLAALEPIILTITLSEKEWQRIKPVATYYADGREYLVLKPDWTDIVVEKVSKETKINCKYAFTKHQFFVGEEFPFFKFYGWCNECKNYIEGECPRAYTLESETISINIRTFDSTKFAHQGKRKIKNKRRKKAKRKAQYVKAAMYRIEAADQLLNYSDVEPADLNNSSTMRKLRQEAIDEALKLTGPTPVFDSLLYLSENGFPEIKEIGQDPFVVNFITDEQILLWNDLKKVQKLRVSIDASGGFSKKVAIRPDETSGYVFLYRMVTDYKLKVAPLWQMLSDAHDTNTIYLGLSLPISLGAPIPDEASTDDCLALLNGGSMAFNGCSYKDFLGTSHRILKGEKLKLKRCRMIMDRAHVMKSPSKWKCFIGKDFDVKDFYKRCIGYSITIESFSILEDVLLSMMIIALSTHCTKNSECWLRKQRLKNRIKTFNQDEYVENSCNSSVHNVAYEDIDDNEDEALNMMKDNVVKDFVMSVHKKALKMLDKQTGVGAMINSLYLPDILTNIIYLYSQYPAWTNCLKALYNSTPDAANSARSEESFKDDKNNHYINYPISANRCVLSLLISINGKVRLVKAALKNSMLEKPTHQEKNKKKQCVSLQGEKHTKQIIVKSEEKVTHSVSMNACTSKMEMPTSNETTATTKLTANETVGVSNGHTFVIRNGNITESISYQGRKIQFKNTCPFDSISEVLCCSFQLGSVKKFVSEGQRCEYLEAIFKFVNNGFKLDNFYVDRAHILFPIVISSPHNKDKSVELSIDCQINAIDLIQNMLNSNSTFLVSTVKECDTEKCDYKGTPKFFNTLTLPFKVIPKIINENSGIGNLQECFREIFDEPDWERCNKCNNLSRRLIYNVGDIVFLETEFIFTSREINRTINSKCPDSVFIHQLRYQLIGVIEIKNISAELNHYMAYCFVNNRWLKKDDLTNSVQHLDQLPSDIKISVAVYAKAND